MGEDEPLTRLRVVAPRPRIATVASGRALRLGLVGVQLGPVAVLLLIGATFSVLTPLFLTEVNGQNLLAQSSVVGALALGQLLVVVTRGIDLSQGSTLALASVVGAKVADGGSASGLVVLLAMLTTGASVGLINGLLLVKLRIGQPFIVTLGMLNVVAGAAFLLSDGAAITGMPQAIQTAGSGFLGEVPVPALIVLGAGAVGFVLTRHLKWGSWLYGVGGDPDVARRVGVPVDRMLISVYVLSGACAAIAAVIVAGRTNSGFPTAGQLSELDAISAVIIGGASFFGGRGGIWNALVGALILGTIRNGLNLLNVSAYWQLVAIGGILVAAVGLDVLRGHIEGRLRVAQAEREDG
jgi:ribose transport system permease protein